MYSDVLGESVNVFSLWDCGGIWVEFKVPVVWDVTDGDVPGHATVKFVPDFQQLLVLQRGGGTVVNGWIDDAPCLTAEFKLASKPCRADQCRQSIVSWFLYQRWRRRRRRRCWEGQPRDEMSEVTDLLADGFRYMS